MLSPRLIDVLALLLQGQSNKHIARDLSLSTETVKEYVATILHRLRVTSRAQVPMTVRSLHEPLLAWDAARRGQVWHSTESQTDASHHAV
jgi:DNA-binding CsgD family transcriptional regulator